MTLKSPRFSSNERLRRADENRPALARGETVKLSSFGTFAVRQKSQRMGRNPKTGDEVPIAPRRVLVFRPSHVLKAVINGQTPEPGGDD